MLYMLIIAHDADFRPSDDLIRDIHAWVDEMETGGMRASGNPLQPPDAATTVSFRDGSISVRSGPFSASTDQMCAYEILDCTSPEEAIECAKKHPMARVAKIEIRPIWSELAGPP